MLNFLGKDAVSCKTSNFSSQNEIRHHTASVADNSAENLNKFFDSSWNQGHPMGVRLWLTGLNL